MKDIFNIDIDLLIFILNFIKKRLILEKSSTEIKIRCLQIIFINAIIKWNIKEKPI